MGGGVHMVQFGVGGGGGGGHRPPPAKCWSTKSPLTSPCRLSNHTITINPTLAFAASWFGHARHVD